MPIKRTMRLNVNLSEGEASMIAAVAEVHGLSMSDLTRRLLRVAYAECFGKEEPLKAAARLKIKRRS